LEVCITFYEKEHWLIHIDINGFLNRLCDIAEAFSKYFESAYSTFCSGTFSSISQYMEI
jgi:hypothetical protein